MRKIWYAAFLMMCISVFTGCNDNDEVKVDEVWKARNEEAINLLRNNPEYSALVAPSLTDTIFYKVLESGTGDRPLITAQVAVRYKGMLINGDVFDMTQGFDTPETDDDLLFVCTLLNTDSPIYYTVIEGWGIVLQHMRVGDRWEVHVPWSLGYGREGKGTAIPGCSTLIYEIQLDRIITQTAF